MSNKIGFEDCEDSSFLAKHELKTPVLYAGANEDPSLVEYFQEYHDWWIKEEAKKTEKNYFKLSDSRFIDLGKGRIVFWGVRNGNTEASAFSNSESVKEFVHAHGIGSHAWNFVSTPSKVEYQDEEGRSQNNMKGSVTLSGDYVSMASFFLDSSQKVVSIDFLGYVSYLKETLPATTKLILTTSSQKQNKELLMNLDPLFASTRVHWIECGDDIFHCNQQVEIRDNGSLRIFVPAPVVQPIEVIGYARKLMPIVESDVTTDAKSIVYIQNSQVQGEELLIQVMRNLLKEVGAVENLKVLDPTMPLLDQKRIFNSATLVIGTTADLTEKMLLMPLPCQINHAFDTLELVTSPEDDDANSSWSSTRHNVLASGPFISNVYNVMYKSSTKGNLDKSRILIDFEGFENAFDAIIHTNYQADEVLVETA